MRRFQMYRRGELPETHTETKPAMTAAACDHLYVYQGRYGKVNHSPLPGTGAKSVEVFDVYYCQYCLHQKRVLTNLVGYQTYGAKPWKGEWIE